MHKVRDPLSGRWERRGRDKNPRAGRGNWKQPWDVGTRRARGKLEDTVTISRAEGAPGRDPGQAETLGGERGRPKDTWGPPTFEAGTLQGLLGKGGDLQSQSRWDIPGKEGNPPTMGATGTSPPSKSRGSALPAAGTPQGQAEASTPVALPQTEIISPCPCPPSPPSRAMGPCGDLRLDPLGQGPDPVSVRDSPRGVWGPPTAGPGTPPHSGSRWPYWGMNRTRGRWNTQSPPAPGLGWK